MWHFVTCLTSKDFKDRISLSKFQGRGFSNEIFHSHMYTTDSPFLRPVVFTICPPPRILLGKTLHVPAALWCVFPNILSFTTDVPASECLSRSFLFPVLSLPNSPPKRLSLLALFLLPPPNSSFPSFFSPFYSFLRSTYYSILMFPCQQ